MAEDKKHINRVLIAEDDPVSRRMLQAFLLKSGYEVEVATDGIEALRALEKMYAPPLAILDWMMPGLEGTQVCQRVRERTDRPYTYVLLLTARSQKDDLLKGLDSGADDYLTKPFDAQELRARLRVGQRILDLQENLIAARDELRFRATHDILTGIANRGVVLDAMHRESSRQLREGGSFGIVLIDLDHFKHVNDMHGHQMGDAVLKETARRMSGCIRPYDTLGRYGGEEFLIVAPSTDGPGVLALAERVRWAISAQPFHGTEGTLHMTASCGVAVSEYGRPLDPNTLLRRADNALYKAKQQGRNRSELAPSAADSSAVAPVDLAQLKT